MDEWYVAILLIITVDVDALLRCIDPKLAVP